MGFLRDPGCATAEALSEGYKGRGRVTLFGKTPFRSRSGLPPTSSRKMPRTRRNRRIPLPQRIRPMDVLLGMTVRSPASSCLFRVKLTTPTSCQVDEHMQYIDELVGLHGLCLRQYINCSLQFKRVHRIPDSMIDCVPFEFDSLPDYLKSAGQQFSTSSALLGALSMAYEDPALNSFDHLLDRKLEERTYCFQYQYDKPNEYPSPH